MKKSTSKRKFPESRTRPASPASPPLGKVLDFMRLIWAIDQALQRTSKHMHRTFGITGPQRLVLRIVGRFPGLSPGDLARHLHVHPSTLTGVLARLERSGLLARTADRHDGRRSRLTLTQKGRRFDIAVEGTVEAAVERALARLRAPQIETTRAVLQTVTESLMDPLSADPDVDRARIAKRSSRQRNRTRTGRRS